MLHTINNKIRRGFSASAKNYDLYTGLHRNIADQLFAQVIKEAPASTFLDVGCGTGYLTVKLKDYFPQSNIVGVDFSEKMLEVARAKHDAIDWIWAEGHALPFPEENFDVVVSNLAYQWAGNLAGTFSEAARVLKTDGVFACTLFGFDTCQELFQSLEEVQGRGLYFNRLPDDNQVRQALLKSGFKNSHVESESIKIEFKNMHELLRWLKSIGANHLSREGYIGRQVLSRAADIYRRHYLYQQGVGATFEVIRVYVKK